jgi:hypothetical protein
LEELETDVSNNSAVSHMIQLAAVIPAAGAAAWLTRSMLRYGEFLKIQNHLHLVSPPFILKIWGIRHLYREHGRKFEIPDRDQTSSHGVSDVELFQERNGCYK